MLQTISCSFFFLKIFLLLLLMMSFSGSLCVLFKLKDYEIILTNTKYMHCFFSAGSLSHLKTFFILQEFLSGPNFLIL